MPSLQVLSLKSCRLGQLPEAARDAIAGLVGACPAGVLDASQNSLVRVRVCVGIACVALMPCGCEGEAA